jgi:hypothetical protein
MVLVLGYGLVAIVANSKLAMNKQNLHILDLECEGWVLADRDFQITI